MDKVKETHVKMQPEKTTWIGISELFPNFGQIESSLISLPIWEALSNLLYSVEWLVCAGDEEIPSVSETDVKSWHVQKGTGTMRMPLIN